ncbi:nucleoside hydrolase [Candidatus Bathyarchaeota archaeon]|nr:nucleoside hydrolase [Candidatus Bathyarchaeota archaeon]
MEGSGELKVLYDGDPGIDDALAILLASRMEDAELIGVTTVAGNCSAVQAARNALNILERVAGRPEVPVAVGAVKPLLRGFKPSYEIHGSDGLGETHLPDPAIKPSRVHGVDMILEAARELGDELTLVTGGPLTNLALAVAKDPSMSSLLKRVVVMGGCIRSPGNATAASEFNVYHDPEAAKIVFNSGLPITLVSLDVTARRENLIRRTDLKALKKRGDAAHETVYRMLSYYVEAYRRYRFMDGCYLHDPLAMLIALEPRLLMDAERIHVDVETVGELTLGRTQADLRRNPSKPPNVVHCLRVDYGEAHSLFRRLIFE